MGDRSKQPAHDALGSDPDEREDASPEPTVAKSKKGGKGGTVDVSAQARRDQNRQAQREFRLRRQQQIKDLQARVELLSGDRDERQEAMSLLVKNLLTENAQLRKLVKDLSGFIGEGLATCLPRLGLTMDSLDSFMNRPETAPAHEAMDALRIAREKNGSDGNRHHQKETAFDDIVGPMSREDTPLAGPSRKRMFDEAQGQSSGPGDRYKRSRPEDSSDNGMRPESARQPEGIPPIRYSDMGHENLQSIHDPYGSGSRSYEEDDRDAGRSRPDEVGDQARERLEATVNQVIEVAEGRQKEAMQLIAYHLTNYRANHAYVLPPSLRPTYIQRSIPHEHLIDGVIFPSLRDKLILMRGKYDIVEVFRNMFTGFSIPGEDTLDHRSWEVNEHWMKENRWLWDNQVLDITNGWRAKRGDHILTRDQLAAV